MRMLLAGLLLTAAVGPLAAADVVVYRGARIYPVSGPVIEKGTLVIEGGKVQAVGADGTVPIPAGAEVRDLGGRTIIPGLVDTHSHIGIWTRPGIPAHQDGNEGSGAIQPALRALDAINPDDPGIRMAVAGGITTANIMPGSGNAIGGQTLYVKLRGQTIEAMRISGKVAGGLKMANGENPKRFNFEAKKQPPATRMKLAALQREQFVKAQEYRKARASKSPPDIDIALEPLVEVLERKRTVHFHSHRADDLMTALRLAEEFNFEIVLQHATEGYRVVDELVRRKVPVSLTLIDSPGGKPETAGLIEENAAILDRAGVKVAINTDDAITESRFYLRTGALAVRGGMSEAAALRALTLNPAEMLHLDDRLGSLAPGKDADFVVLSGPPFSVYTQVLQTYIDGRLVFDRTRDTTYQTGGFAVADPGRLPRPSEPARPLPPVATPTPAAGTTPLRGAQARFAVLAGRIHTGAGETITDGVVIVENGRIVEVGPRNRVVVRPGTPVLTAAVVTPGLIDAHAVVPASGALNLPADQDQDEVGDPNGADLRVLDTFNPSEPLLEFLRQTGVTTIQAMPGRANVIAGQAGVFRTGGTTAERMLVGRFPSALLVNLGEVPKSSAGGKAPTTRMATASLVRNAFVQAQNDARKRGATKEGDKAPPRNLKLEAIQLALERKIPVVFAAHRADDVTTALRLADEFGLRARIDLATEGYLIAERLAAANVPVVIHPTMQRAGASMETLNSHLANAAALAQRNIPLAIGTGYEAYVPKTRVLRSEAAMAMAHGLGFDRALRAVSLDAARILGIDRDYGSLEKGKVADLVLYDGDPFEHTTHVTHTLMGGRVVFDRTEYLRLPYARRALPLTSSGSGVGCCLGIW